MHAAKLTARRELRRQGGEKFCLADARLPMRIMLSNVPGEPPRSMDLMWKENVGLVALIGIDRIAGVRTADGTLNDSCCQNGYLGMSDPRPSKQTRTPRTQGSRSWNQPRAAPLLCCVIHKVVWGTRFLLLLFILPCFSSSLFFFSSCPPSGRAHGAFGAALVDGLSSTWNGGLRLSRLPPLSHHHLLQGHQEVGGFLPYV